MGKGRAAEDGATAREARRVAILEAAEQLLVDSGVERMRLRDVAEAAGVSIGTIQHYFDTRDRLVAELFDWSARRRLAAWTAAGPDDADPWRRVVTLLERALAEPFLRRSRVWIEFLAMARVEALRGHLAAFQGAWRAPFSAAIEAGTASGAFRPALPVDDIVDLLIMGVDGAEVAAVLAGPTASRERLVARQVAAARVLLGVADATPSPA